MNLMTESLWGDEAFSALAVMKSFPEMIGVVMRDTAPPLFYLVGYAWGHLFGYSEVALRSLTLLLMIGTAVFAGLIVARIDKSRLKAVIAGALAFSSPFLIPFAFEWRMYALFALTVTASTYFFMSQKWKAYVALSLAALYTHHFAVFTIFGQVVWFFLTQFSWRDRRKWRKQMTPFFWIGLGYAFWLYPLVVQIRRVAGSGFWLVVPKFSDLADLLVRFATGGVGKSYQWLVGGLGLLFLATKDWRRTGKAWVGLLLIFLAPVLLSFGLSQILTPIFYDRYLLSVAVGGSVLWVVGTKSKFVPLLLVILAIYLLESWSIFTTPRKRPFRELAAYIKTQIQPNDFLLNWNSQAHHLWESKYYDVPAPIYTPNGPLPLYVGTAQMTADDIVSKLPDRPRIGLIASEDPKDILLPGYKMTMVRQLGELRFMWWNKIK